MKRLSMVLVAMMMAVLLLPSIRTASIALASITAWSATGTMTVDRVGHGIVVLPNGEVLVAGGRSSWANTTAVTVLASSELYDPEIGQWSATGALNSRRFNYNNNMVMLDNGKALIAGGSNVDASGNDLASAELYDPAVGTWSFTGSLNTPRRNATMTKLLDGRVLVTGGARGSGGGRFLSSAEIYDPEAGTWSNTGSLSVAREIHSAVLLHDGRVLVVGGEGPWNVNSPVVEIYNPATGSWITTGSVSTGRQEFSLTVLQDGKVLLAGGSNRQLVFASAEIFDPNTGAWTAVESMASPRAGNSSALLPDGRVLVIAGNNLSGMTPVGEIYDPLTASWISDAALEIPRSQPRLVTLDDGRLLVVGGVQPDPPDYWLNSWKPVASSELYPHAFPNHPPTANAGGPYEVVAGQPITLTGSGTDPDAGDTLTFDWDLDGDSSFETAGKVVTFSAAAFTGDGSQNVTVRVCDQYGACGVATTQIIVRSPITIITPSPLPSGMAGELYSVTLEATGGTEPYTWSLTSGDLPDGLSLNASSGEISGTPTAAGVFGFTILVTDSSHITTTKRFTLQPPPSTGDAGEEYPSTPINIPPPDDLPDTSACTDYTLVPGSDLLPSGMMLDPLTGVLSGTPTDGGTYHVIVQCTFSTSQTATADFTITIYNPVPALTIIDPGAVIEDGPDLNVTIIGTGFVLGSVVQWNGSSRATTYVSATQMTVIIPASDMAEPGQAVITVVNGGPGGGTSNELIFTIDPKNRPPVAEAGGPYIVDESGSVTLDGSSSSDPDSDPLTFEWDFDGDGLYETAGSHPTFSASSVDGPSTVEVTLRVMDGGQLSATDVATVTILNVAPTIDSLSLPIDPNAITSGVTGNASFHDSGLLDTHAATWDWGDGSTSVGAVTFEGGSGAITGSHIYQTAGVYRVTLSVCDDDGGCDSATFEYVVVYDPSAGFVTGGGWIASPAGAYLADPELTGKANFGFVARYKKGANTPEGNTEFQFKAGSLNFKSTSYQWLVVAGAKVKFKGEGTINGEGDYGFMLTATDGQRNGGGGTDKFRMKIWDIATGTTVYDNQMGAEDDADANTTLGGGSIVIHK